MCSYSVLKHNLRISTTMFEDVCQFCPVLIATPISITPITSITSITSSTTKIYMCSGCLSAHSLYFLLSTKRGIMGVMGVGAPRKIRANGNNPPPISMGVLGGYEGYARSPHPGSRKKASSSIDRLISQA